MAEFKFVYPRFHPIRKIVIGSAADSKFESGVRVSVETGHGETYHSIGLVVSAPSDDWDRGVTVGQVVLDLFNYMSRHLVNSEGVKLTRDDLDALDEIVAAGIGAIKAHEHSVMNVSDLNVSR